MKQKLLFVVILICAIYMPASSRECGKQTCLVQEQTKVTAVAEIVKVIKADAEELPVSPLAHLLFDSN
jgi:hypothetical protein